MHFLSLLSRMDVEMALSFAGAPLHLYTVKFKRGDEVLGEYSSYQNEPLGDFIESSAEDLIYDLAERYLLFHEIHKQKAI